MVLKYIKHGLDKRKTHIWCSVFDGKRTDKTPSSAKKGTYFTEKAAY